MCNGFPKFEMFTIPIKCILAILLAVSCQCRISENFGVSSSWAKLQISPDTFSSMEYGNFLIEIYEHANNNHKSSDSQKKYFYSPIALLDHTSAVSIYNRVTKQPEMRFRIEMWNDKVQKEVVKYLNKIVGQEIQSDNVRVLPLEKVILTSKRVSTEDYFLSSEWTNYDKSKTLWFSLSCFDQKICDELANEMRSDPKHLNHFKLLYSLSSQTSQTKQAIIGIDSVTSGQIFSTLLRKFGDKKEIFLTINDEKKMLTEMATNIRMETFDDSEVGSPDAEITIYSFLKDLLVTSRTTIRDQSDKMWDSVFWNDDNYRPDKTTKTLNQILNKLDTETQKKLADMFQKHGNVNENWKLAKNCSNEENKNFENKDKMQHNYDSNSWADLDRISSVISGKMTNKSDGSKQVEILKEDVEKLLQKSRDNVQWDGEKFVPKPMQLSRINLGKFRDSQSFQDRNIRVRYTTAELSAPIKIMEHAEFTVTDEWNNLKEELKATTELLKTTVNNLVKTNTELSDAKSDLTNTRIVLTNQLEGTKKELEKTKIDLEETKANINNLSIKLNETKQELVKTREAFLIIVNDLSAKLNATENESGETKITTGKLTTELKTELVDTRTSEIVDIGQMPTSCADLERMGHKLSGFFSVKGSRKMEMIYCDFNANQNDKQKWIGYVDVKSAPVHFYVQRNSSFEIQGTPIPFDLARVNEGNAMNLTSGIFTAPRPGIYFFSFAGVARLYSSLYDDGGFFIYLFLNGGMIGSSDVQEYRGPVDQYSPVTLQSTLNLKKDDQVWVVISGSSPLRDDSFHRTHFTGSMLEEEIVASL